MNATATHAIDVLTKQCLIRENWRELEKLKDSGGEYRSIIIGVPLTEKEKYNVNRYFNSTRFYFDFIDMMNEGTGLPSTIIKIYIDKG